MLDKFGKPILTVADSSNPWWFLFEEAIRSADGKVGKAEILLGSTDASFFRQRGLPAIGFSAIANTPERVHDHNEVHGSLFSCTAYLKANLATIVCNSLIDSNS